MTFAEKLANSIVILDGAMGTMLQERGLPAGTPPEAWNLANPSEVEAVHRAYIAAGADVVYANTFGAHPFRWGERTEEVVSAGVAIARRAAKGAGRSSPSTSVRSASFSTPSRSMRRTRFWNASLTLTG